ncbi:hypothetical protein [Streptomyces solincola]|uniref:hypothetical protein n=1 Tax=Streptomyces solincola TaxID=2100817 RepID=UPI0011B230E9|nr:hypothetical protein [Streptomyces solincola]
MTLSRRAALIGAAGLLAGGCAPRTPEDGSSGTDPGDGAAVRAAIARRTAPVLPGVTLAAWALRPASVHLDGDRASARAELAYRVAGYDTAPVTAARDLELRRTAGSWRVTAERPAPGAAAQPWDQGPVRAARGARSLVLAVGQLAEKPAEVARAADRAVAAASAAWPDPWADRVLVLLPPSQAAMGALLGQPGAAYAGTAAVTTGRTGRNAPADRVVVNPEEYAGLSALGREVVLAHETVHVATRRATTARTPLWLSEGFAEWAAWRGRGQDPRTVAPELARSGPPEELPGDGDFAFGSDPAALARAYEGAHLACALVAEEWDADRLRALYRAAGGAGGPAGALRRVLGLTPRAFTARWRAYAERTLRG